MSSTESDRTACGRSSACSAVVPDDHSRFEAERSWMGYEDSSKPRGPFAIAGHRAEMMNTMLGELPQMGAHDGELGATFAHYGQVLRMRTA